MTNRLAARLFGWLLLAYPPEFRRRYGDDMQALFAARSSEARAAGRAGRFWVRTLVNVAATAAAERWSRRRAQTASARDSRKGRPMFGFIQDARYALRLLRRQPAFASFVVLTLGVGIGANTAVFSVVDGVLLRPLPYKDSDRLVAVRGRFDPESGFDFPSFPLSNPEYLDYRESAHALADVAAYGSQSVTVGGPGADPERVPAAAVTENLFSVLGVQPMLGRTFSSDEARTGGPEVAILSYGYWQARFGGDPAVLGRAIPLNGVPTVVVGVMGSGFAYPAETTRMWRPLRIDPASPGSRQGHSIRAIGRLAPGVDLESARKELGAIMADWKRRFPDIHTGHYLLIRPLLEDIAGTVRPALLLLLAATGFVLLIVCANVASIVLARGETRVREMAIRGALGAERRRLVRLSLVESGALALAGGVVGLALGYAGVRMLLAIDPAGVPRSAEIGLDWRLVAFAAASSVASAVLFGLLPALRGATADLQSTLREASHAATAGAGRLWFRRLLVVAEVSLSVCLVVGAALMLRSFDRLLGVEPGFRSDGLLTASLALPRRDYPEAAQVDGFYATLIERLRAAPAFSSVSAGTTIPLWNDQGVWDFEIDGRPRPGAGQVAWNAAAVIVRPGYFETLGIPLVRGRLFAEQDDDRAQPVAIVNQAMAAKFFAGDDPIGRRIRVFGGQNGWMTIVGISGDVRTESLDAPARPAYHFLQAQTPQTIQGPTQNISIVARVNGSTEAAVSALRSAVRQLDPALALYDVQTSRAIVDQSVARPRFTTRLLTVFAGVGLLLGASGIYGVLAYTVARRTHEIGIRRALGAQTGRVVREIVASGMAPVGVGLAIGLVAAYWSTRLWQEQLFEVSPADPVVYAAVSAGIVVVALVATIVPVRRAVRVSPLVALRSE